MYPETPSYSALSALWWNLFQNLLLCTRVIKLFANTRCWVVTLEHTSRYVVFWAVSPVKALIFLPFSAILLPLPPLTFLSTPADHMPLARQDWTHKQKSKQLLTWCNWRHLTIPTAQNIFPTKCCGAEKSQHWNHASSLQIPPAICNLSFPGKKCKACSELAPEESREPRAWTSPGLRSCYSFSVHLESHFQDLSSLQKRPLESSKLPELCRHHS